MNIDVKTQKPSTKYWHTTFNSISKRSYTMIKVVSVQRWFNIPKLLNAIQYIN
jgi:hypothetical protein